MHLSPRFIRFISVGVINTVVDAGIFAALHTAGAAIGLANFVSTSVGIGLSLVLNSRYTFHVKRPGRHQILAFVGINIVGLWLLQPLVIVLLIHIVKDSRIVPDTIPAYGINFGASLAATGVTFLWNYTLYRKLVFRSSP